MGEHSVAQARASVMIYNNDIKKWEHAGGSQGISRVHIYFNPKTDTYRIVGRKVNDNEVVINCLLGKNLKYNKATPTFHQWRDQRQVYGLNFQSPDDANVFSEGVSGAVENLNNPPQQQQSLNYNGTDSLNESQQLQQRYIEEQQQQAQYRRPEPQRIAQQTQVEYRPPAPDPPKQPPTVRSVPVAPNPVIPAQPQPTPTAVPAPPPAPTPPSGAAPPPAPPPPPVPPAPPAPGPPSSAPAPPPAPPGGGAPPPPPPPPPPGGGGGAPPPPGGGGLASALAGVTLKKRSVEPAEEKRPPPQANPMDDMMSALNKKLLARKKAAEGGEDSSKSSEEQVAVQPKVQPAPSKAPASPFNARSNSVKVPGSASAPLNKTAFSRTSSNAVSGSNEDLNLSSLREELIKVIKEEVQAAKEEIIEALRQELRKSS